MTAAEELRGGGLRLLSLADALARLPVPPNPVRALSALAPDPAASLDDLLGPLTGRPEIAPSDPEAETEERPLRSAPPVQAPFPAQRPVPSSRVRNGNGRHEGSPAAPPTKRAGPPAFPDVPEWPAVSWPRFPDAPEPPGGRAAPPPPPPASARPPRPPENVSPAPTHAAPVTFWRGAADGRPIFETLPAGPHAPETRNGPSAQPAGVRRTDPMLPGTNRPHGSDSPTGYAPEEKSPPRRAEPTDWASTARPAPPPLGPVWQGRPGSAGGPVPVFPESGFADGTAPPSPRAPDERLAEGHDGDGTNFVAPTRFVTRADGLAALLSAAASEAEPTPPWNQPSPAAPHEPDVERLLDALADRLEREYLRTYGTTGL